MHDRFGRRSLLKRWGALSAMSLAPIGCATDDDPEPLPERQVFLHGVASGDPLPTGVILWTRVTTVDGAPVTVTWEMAPDAAFSDVAASGEITTDADRDHTVKIDVGGASPATTYFFRFTALGETSPIGRARTAPDGEVDRLRMAVCSCASLAHGYFNAYRRIAARADLDLVVVLGDYIYEYATDSYGKLRAYDPPHEIVTLEDYRRRYAHYRRDPDLQELHRQHPVVAVWDDHETANNAYAGGAENHSPGEGDWEERKAMALRAYLEWMPIREQPDGRLWRNVRLGALADLVMLDTRIWGRDEQALGEDDPTLADPDRTLLGDDQEAWLGEQLATSSARWKILGQQVMVGQLPQFLNVDQWDGYPAARGRLFDAIRATTDVVVLTGDIHSSWGIDLTDDPFDPAYDPQTGAGSIGVDVVVPGITSPGFPDMLAGVAEGIREDNPHMKYVDLTRRGYVVLDVSEARVQADWYHPDTILEVSDLESLGGALSVDAGDRSWIEAAGPAPEKTGPPPLAPPDPYRASPRP